MCVCAYLCVRERQADRQVRHCFLDWIVTKYEIYKIPKCTQFGMKCLKWCRFLGFRPRPRWGAYDASSDPLVVRGSCLRQEQTNRQTERAIPLGECLLRTYSIGRCSNKKPRLAASLTSA